MTPGNQTHYERSIEGRTYLTPREQEIVALIHADVSSKEIAERLCISHSTVEAHIYRIHQVLGVHTRVAVALYWERRLAAKAGVV